MSEGNGEQESGSERLNRIERALELILNDHIQFREEHKLLLSAQVLMQGGLEELRKSTADLRLGLDDLRKTVGTLATNVEAMRLNFDQRLKLLESPRVQ